MREHIDSDELIQAGKWLTTKVIMWLLRSLCLILLLFFTGPSGSHWCNSQLFLRWTSEPATCTIYWWSVGFPRKFPFTSFKRWCNRSPSFWSTGLVTTGDDMSLGQWNKAMDVQGNLSRWPFPYYNILLFLADWSRHHQDKGAYHDSIAASIQPHYASLAQVLQTSAITGRIHHRIMSCNNKWLVWWCRKLPMIMFLCKRMAQLHGLHLGLKFEPSSKLILANLCHHMLSAACR